MDVFPFLFSLYTIIHLKSLIFNVVELRGFEPLTFSLRTRRSTN